MSKTLQIRDVPDDVHSALRARASAAGVSLSEYALRQLSEAAERPLIAEVLQRAGQRSGGAELDDIVAAVRAGRDRDF